MRSQDRGNIRRSHGYLLPCDILAGIDRLRDVSSHFKALDQAQGTDPHCIPCLITQIGGLSTFSPAKL